MIRFLLFLLLIFSVRYSCGQVNDVSMSISGVKDKTLHKKMMDDLRLISDSTLIKQYIQKTAKPKRGEEVVVTIVDIPYLKVRSYVYGYRYKNVMLKNEELVSRGADNIADDLQELIVAIGDSISLMDSMHIQFNVHNADFRKVMLVAEGPLTITRTPDQWTITRTGDKKSKAVLFIVSEKDTLSQCHISLEGPEEKIELVRIAKEIKTSYTTLAVTDIYRLLTPIAKRNLGRFDEGDLERMIAFGSGVR